MHKKIDRFRINENLNSPSFIRKLNIVVDALNASLNTQVNVIGGKGGIKHGPKGASINIDLSSLRARIGTSGGGAIKVIIVRDLKYDDPDRVFPDSCTFGTPGDPWALADQKFYIVRRASDSTATYSPSTEYIIGDFCLFNVLATSVTDEPFAEIGFGYTLKYRATAATTGAFDENDWVLVDDFSEGQWKIEIPLGEVEVKDMRKFVPWFVLAEILPIIKIVISAETFYLIWQTHIEIETGSGITKSISWNQADNRMMAVFR